MTTFILIFLGLQLGLEFDKTLLLSHLVKFYCRSLQEHLRTPNGRPLALLNIDTTDIMVDKTSDAFAQMQTYSGDRGKKHCLFFSNLTDSLGRIIAVTPGPNIACTPRGGDGVSLGVHLGQAQATQRTTGQTPACTRLLGGTPRIGVGLDFDRGYKFLDRVNTGNNPNLIEVCADLDILPLYRTAVGEMAFVYNADTDLLEQIQNNRDPTLAANGGRIATFLRTGSEQTHLFKRQYQYFAHRVHNSRLNAVGAQTIQYYNRIFGKQLPQEFAENSKLNIEYLVMAGLYNRFHAKFSRYCPDLVLTLS